MTIPRKAFCLLALLIAPFSWGGQACRQLDAGGATWITQPLGDRILAVPETFHLSLTRAGGISVSPPACARFDRAVGAAGFANCLSVAPGMGCDRDNLESIRSESITLPAMQFWWIRLGSASDFAKSPSVASEIARQWSVSPARVVFGHVHHLVGAIPANLKLVGGGGSWTQKFKHAGLSQARIQASGGSITTYQVDAACDLMDGLATIEWTQPVEAAPDVAHPLDTEAGWELYTTLRKDAEPVSRNPLMRAAVIGARLANVLATRLPDRAFDEEELEDIVGSLYDPDTLRLRNYTTRDEFQRAYLPEILLNGVSVSAKFSGDGH